MPSLRYSKNASPGAGPRAPLRGTRIAIATSHGRHYYRFARSLRALGVGFDSILPEAANRYAGDLVFSTRAESPSRPAVPVLDEDASGKHPVVLCGLILQKTGACTAGDELVLGVDPGSRTGLSVFYGGREIGASFHTTVDGLVMHMIEIMAGLGARRKIVRVGRGSRRSAARICELLNLNYCSSFDLEIVDEHGTSPRARSLNSRGLRDMLSARAIAQRPGRRARVLPHSISG